MLAELSIFPLDKGVSLSKYVAMALDEIDRSGLTYRLGPMSTTIEGPLDKVYDLVKKIHKKMRRKSKRVTVYLRVDDKAGRKNAMKYKPSSVEKKVGRKLRQ